MVEAYYDPRKNPGSIPGEDASWVGKLYYIRKRLATFSGNKEGDTLY